MTQGNLEEQTGDVHSYSGVNVGVCSSVCRIVGICHMSDLEGSGVSLGHICHVGTVTGIVQLYSGNYLLTIVGKPGLTLTSVNGKAVNGVGRGDAVIVTGLTVVVIKRAVVCNSGNSVVYRLVKSIYGSVILGIEYKTLLKLCFTEQVHPASLGVTVYAEAVKIEVVGLGIGKGDVAEVTHSGGIDLGVVVDVYRIGHLVAADSACIVVRVTVIVTEAVIVRHRNVEVIEHSACIAVEEEAVHVRTVSGLYAGSQVSRGVGNAHYGNCLFGIGRIGNVNVKIQVNRSTVGVHAVGDSLGNGVLYLGVLAVHVSGSACVVPGDGGSVCSLTESLLAGSVGAYPLDQLIGLTAAEIVVPVLNDLLESTVCAVLISLPENVVQTDIVACGNNVVIVISSGGEDGIGKVGLALYLVTNILNRPVEVGRGGLLVVQVVEHYDHVATLQHGGDDSLVGIGTDTLDVGIDHVDDYGSTAVAGLHLVVSLVKIDGKLNGNSYVAVVGYFLSLTYFVVGEGRFYFFHSVLLGLGRSCLSPDTDRTYGKQGDEGTEQKQYRQKSFCAHVYSSLKLNNFLLRI